MERKPFSSLFFHLLDIIFPSVCILCDKYTLFDKEPICPECWAKAKPIKEPLCKKCGLPMGFVDQSGSERLYLCAICRQKEWEFDMARAGFIFDGPVRDASHMLKYRGHFGIGAWLGQKMGEMLKHTFYYKEKENKEEILIIPVPLSPERLRDREFNHSFALARPISKSFVLPMSTSTLQRKYGAKPQVGLTPRERWSNVRGAFSLKRAELVRGKRIILVDDVLTTGATSNECARVLKKAGAIRVEVLTLARTL